MNYKTSPYHRETFVALCKTWDDNPPPSHYRKTDARPPPQTASRSPHSCTCIREMRFHPKLLHYTWIITNWKRSLALSVLLMDTPSDMGDELEVLAGIWSCHLLYPSLTLIPLSYHTWPEAVFQLTWLDLSDWCRSATCRPSMFGLYLKLGFTRVM